MDPNDAARLAELRRYAILDTAPDPAFDRLTELAARTCGMPIALVSLVDEHRLWFKSCFGLKATEADRAQALCANTILGAEPLVVTDATLDLRFANGLLVTDDPGIRFYAGVPLITAAGFALGTLCVIDQLARTLSPAQLDTLKLIADQVVQQFELHRMANALQRQSASLARTQAAAHIGGWELDLQTQQLSWSEETYRIHELTPEDYRPEVASALSFYSPASAVQIREAVNALIERGTTYDLELQLVTRSGGHRWVRATGQHGAGVEADRLYGVFQDITERRNLESEVILIAQREQKRIGLDLHDGLGQTLTGVSLLLRHVAGDVPDTLPHVQQNLSQIESLVSEAVGTCRELSHGLAPVSEQRGGLEHALKSLGLQFKHVHGIHISVDIRGFARPPESIAEHLYRIAREALTNAVRHAGARQIALILESNPAQIRLLVHDDGSGFAPSSVIEGMGISIMKYRARLIGAILRLEPRPRGGTEVCCLLNLAHLGEPARDAVWALKGGFER